MRYAYFDIHSHLNFPEFDSDRDDILARMREEGIGTITVGTGLATSREALQLAALHEHVFATVGIHPTDAEEIFDEAAFDVLANNPKVVAVGECGLDYYRDDAPETKARQKELFSAHIAFAKKHDLPLMIHGRASRGSQDAYEDILSTLEGSGCRGNVHFFAGSPDIARRFLDLGFTLSFDGPITFSRDYDEVIRLVPEDMIMVETDSPFAAPAPYRGRRCDPTMVRHVAEAIADIRGVERESMGKKLVENALRAFKIPGELRS
ncbi:MAG: TatD family hydrolase [Candidatus Campbellbacteria bacterium]